jgi:predicted molibdopterin-dependent oxidoreductase YjgC
MTRDSMTTPPGEVTITVDGAAIGVRAGQTLAAALLGAGIRQLRRSPRAAAPRGAFCMMGVCQECLVRVGGDLVQACVIEVVAGMAVRLDRA